MRRERGAGSGERGAGSGERGIRVIQSLSVIRVLEVAREAFRLRRFPPLAPPQCLAHVCNRRDPDHHERHRYDSPRQRPHSGKPDAGAEYREHTDSSFRNGERGDAKVQPDSRSQLQAAGCGGEQTEQKQENAQCRYADRRRTFSRITTGCRSPPSRPPSSLLLLVVSWSSERAFPTSRTTSAGRAACA